MSQRKPVTLSIVGTGRMAHTLAAALAAANWPVAAVAGRRPGAIAGVKRKARAGCGTRSIERAAELADLVLLAVSDRAIVPLARELSRSAVDFRHKTVLHHAGALGPDALDALRRRGAAVGLLHPLQTLSRSGLSVELLTGTRTRIEGQPRAVHVARRLARAIGMIPLRLPRALRRQDRVAYHAAASLVSNDLVGLFTAAVEILESIGPSRDEAIAALLPLAHGTLSQLADSGLGGGLTGPVARGDVETLANHLDELSRRAPDAALIHRVLSRTLLKLAEADGPAVTAESREQMRRLLDRRTAGRRKAPGV